MGTVLLSIIIPIYNVEKYLNKCLDSILKQDVDGETFEVVCVDDGSTDRSLEILREYSEKYSNLKILSSGQKGGGPSNARNVGLDYAIGDYFWFVDSDDYISDGAIKKILEIIQEENPELISVSLQHFFDGDVEPVNDMGNAQWEWVEPFPFKAVSLGIGKMALLKECYNGGRFVNGLKHNEDCLFWFAYFIEQKQKTIALSNTAYFYRQRKQGSLTGNLRYSKNKSVHDKKFEDSITCIKIREEINKGLTGYKREVSEKLINDYRIEALEYLIVLTSYNVKEKLIQLRNEGFISQEQYDKHRKKLRFRKLKEFIKKILNK